MSNLLSIGKSALFASYAAMQATSNNIANANTAGYSRQTVDLNESKGLMTSVGFFGSGVDVTTISRSYDQYLTQQANNTSWVSAADQSQLDMLNQLETVFPTGTTGIGYTAGQLFNSFVDVANTPSDSSARQVVISQAQQLATQISSAGQQVATLQSGVRQDVSTQIDTVNAMAQQLATLNQQISNLNGAGQPPNDLLDQRDQLVKQIGNIIDVTPLTADDGSIGLFVGGGQALVLGSNANTLVSMQDLYDPAKVQIGIKTGAGPAQVVPSSSITGGSIGGLLKFQNEDLTAASQMLGQMATAISGAVNQQQALGLNLNGNPGDPMFAVGPTRVLNASDNKGDASLSITISDSSQVHASDYKMSFDGSNYSLVRTSDGSTMPGSPYTPAQLAAGVTVDGMTVKLNQGSAQSGDSFLLQPVSNAALQMQEVLDDPNGLAAASPFTASTGASNTGTATIAGLSAVSTNYTPSITTNLTFTDNNGGYSYTMSDGTTGTGTWTAGQPITLNGFALSLNGVPRSGDTIAVAPTTSVASNNGNAQAYVNLGTAGIVQGADVTDSYAAVVASIGVRVQTVTTQAAASSSAATDAETTRANSAGVNLDEEATRLMQFQQSYQAAAKILQVAQTIFDTLIQTVSG